MEAMHEDVTMITDKDESGGKSNHDEVNTRVISYFEK